MENRRKKFKFLIELDPMYLKIPPVPEHLRSRENLGSAPEFFFYEVNVRTLRGIKPARVIRYLPLPPVVKSGHLKP